MTWWPRCNPERSTPELEAERRAERARIEQERHGCSGEAMIWRGDEDVEPVDAIRTCE